MQANQDKNTIREIVSFIKAQENNLRCKLPILAQQNSLGLALLLFSVLGFMTSGILYFYGLIPAWVCIVLGALSTSITHEIEHDLIHMQYFKTNSIMYHLMMFLVWIIRPSTINPWYRKSIHLNHHKTSGTQQDIEERLVGNGTKSHFLRLLVICDGLLGLILRTKQFSKEIKGYNFLRLFNAGFPLTTLYYIIIYAFVLFHGANFILESLAIATDYPAWFMSLVDYMNLAMVVWVAPSFLRSACLNFVTSSMHYYGGVYNLIQQTQVLNHWAFIPFQLFCFNFGNSHTIHHFVPGQPFYIRQMISKKVNAFMQEKGVRFNDLASILAANRFRTSDNL
ncbi:fatty acid desaturase [Paraglaciecola aquimarina]|uniref:Fatty acid desaturase n=1 Tax=Paraglaciecola algarum TaxID=3050085 RepID=A0ABS9D913_9ALTE|nr:fatty acid desaturase [Paraglaciecola sp. G1-23]MCF2949423.1 fatty acid desaturase [Paraglaciecola sp. G1-23]